MKKVRIIFLIFPSVIRLGATTRSKKAGKKTIKQTNNLGSKMGGLKFTKL
jgi:hypothetical protein